MSCRYVIPRVFRPSPPFLPLLVKPLSISAALPLLRLHASPSANSRCLCRRVVSSPWSLSSDDAELHGGGGESAVRVLSDAVEKRSVPELTVKEKKELASYAHSLGDKLKSQQIGKSGVTPNVVFALNETLEANELLKLKIHRSCPGEVDEIVKQLELGTGSVAVAQIGRVVIFYRPSLSKLKAVEKKKQARKLYLQTKLKFSPTTLQVQGSREAGPGRRGSSRGSEAQAN